MPEMPFEFRHFLSGVGGLMSGFAVEMLFAVAERYRGRILLFADHRGDLLGLPQLPVVVVSGVAPNGVPPTVTTTTTTTTPSTTPTPTASTSLPPPTPATPSPAVLSDDRSRSGPGAVAADTPPRVG
jgi:hypothetical protein